MLLEGDISRGILDFEDDGFSSIIEGVWFSILRGNFGARLALAWS